MLKGSAASTAERLGFCHPGPYEQLHIYLLDGVVGEAEESLFGEGYIGNWVEGDTSFLFFSESSEEGVARLLQIRPDLKRLDTFRFTYDQWQGGRAGAVHVEPFFIVPPWEPSFHGKEQICIKLDPGVVFGNGLHPTTAHCLKALDVAARTGPLGKVLDLGTGSGILALAAALLDAHEVWAVDLNPLCVRTAENNVRLNGMTHRIRVAQGPAELFWNVPADLVVVNIHHGVIAGMLDGRPFRKGARIILSGLMRSQAGETRAQLQRLGFCPTREWDHEMTWFTFLAEKA